MKRLLSGDRGSRLLRIPKSIQPHGALLVARRSDLRVLYVSENAEKVTQIPTQVMLGMSLLNCLNAEIAIEIAKCDVHKLHTSRQPRTQTIARGVGTRHHFDIFYQDELVYVEIELELVAPETDRLPVCAQMVTDVLQSTGSLEELLESTAVGLRKLTGYDRVMVYRFVDEGHGRVVAEDRAHGMMPYKDLQFPSSNLPTEEMERHLRQRIEVIPNVRYEPVSMIAEPIIRDDMPALDMTYCKLNSPSPIELEHAKVMRARAVLTVSLVVDEQLWGLLVCHHRVPRLPSAEMRSICELLGQVVSSMIRQSIERSDRLKTMQRQTAMTYIASQFETTAPVFDCIVTSRKEILELVEADGALLHIDGQSMCIGNTPPLEASLELMKLIFSAGPADIVSSDCIRKAIPVPDILNESGSGVMAMALPGAATNAILWFRQEAVETITWVRAPDQTEEIIFGSRKRTARKRIGTQTTVVTGHSLPWTEVDLHAAGGLSRAIAMRLLKNVEDKSLHFDALDTLTMLPNRQSFERRLLEWGEGRKGLPAAVILVGIDRFRLFDTALGHPVADDLVLQLVQKIHAVAAGDNIVFARLDGDEFALLCLGCTWDEAQNLSARIGKALAEPFHMLEKSFHITARLGLAYGLSDSKQDLMRNAETALHFAKQSDKRSVSFDKRLQNTMCARLELEQDLYRAIEQKQFSLVYQPIVALPGNEVLGFEALLRWNHPTKGVLRPSEFISIAEEERLMIPIGEWVFSEALRQLASWRRSSGQPLVMHVNASAPELATGGFADMVKDLLRRENLSAQSLSIEVTESALLCESALPKLNELRRLGVGVSVDDFGTGYSSLSTLRKLPADTVKIDRSFVLPITEDAAARDFIAAILKMTETLGLRAIAEGVETEEQLAALSDMGCQFIQGYVYSVPLSAADVPALLQPDTQDALRITLTAGGLLTHAA